MYPQFTFYKMLECCFDAYVCLNLHEAMFSIQSHILHNSTIFALHSNQSVSLTNEMPFKIKK